MAKIPPRKVPSDDCLVYVGRRIEGKKIVDPGTPYAVHEGEYVEISGVSTLAQSLGLMEMVNTASHADNADQAHVLETALNNLCAEVARRVLSWNWTDNEGNALAQPHNHPNVIKSLSEDELLWLTQAIRGETSGQRKNDCAPTEASSLAPTGIPQTAPISPVGGQPVTA